MHFPHYKRIKSTRTNRNEPERKICANFAEHDRLTDYHNKRHRWQKQSGCMARVRSVTRHRTNQLPERLCPIG